MNKLAIWAGQVDRLLAKRSAAITAANAEQDHVRAAQLDLDAIGQAQVLAQEVAADIQTTAIARVCEIVTHCLQLVFDDSPYTFSIQFEEKRGKTEARMVFLRDGVEIPPLTASGGGPVDVAAFGLRLATLALRMPQGRRIMVMDEPFRFVSETGGYRDQVRAMVEALATEMDFQFIIVTHMPQLRMGTVIDLG